MFPGPLLPDLIPERPSAIPGLMMDSRSSSESSESSESSSSSTEEQPLLNAFSNDITEPSTCKKINHK